MSLTSPAADAPSVLPDSASHGRADGEGDEDEGEYQFNAAAFPWLFDTEECARKGISMEQLTPLRLNQQGGTNSETTSASASHSNAPSVGNCSGSGSVPVRPSPRLRSGGLDLTMHESHSGSWIGSVVWEGGRVLAWLLETMHDRVRELRNDGSGFEDQPPRAAEAPFYSGTEDTADAAASLIAAPSPSSFTSPSLLEYLRARASGHCFDLPRNFLVGKRVLELGAGTGISGLACVKLGAREVVLTDIAELGELMRENVRRNCPGTLRQQWRDTRREKQQTQARGADTALHMLAAADSPAIPASSSSSPTAATAVCSALPPAMHPCSNCDELCVKLHRCAPCDATLCGECDAAFHRPASKRSHKRREMSGEEATVAAALPHSAMVDPSVAPPLPLPPHCDVYVEELLWGEADRVESLAPSLRAPFDVLILADVVYDAYSTRGAGSGGCNTFRKLFRTLCMLVPPDLHPSPTILLTYTPRRAPEALFFELLATAFVWECYTAQSLLPDHADQVDERIWVYHLHRTDKAGKMNALRQRAYIHGAGGVDEGQGQVGRRKKEEEEAAPDASPAASVSSADPSPSRSSSGSTVVEGSPRAPPPPVARHLTPSFIRYLESEEQRQQAVMQARMEAVRSRRRS